MSYYRHVPNKIKKTCGKLESFGHSLLFWDMSISQSGSLTIDFAFMTKSTESHARHIFIIIYLNVLILYAFVSFRLIWGLKNNMIFSITTLSLDPYPRIAGDSHILFQPITAISSLLDLIGPLPQGRRLFGPTVLESRQPSRSLPIFFDRHRMTVHRREEKQTSSLLIFNFQFWNSSKRLEEECKSKNLK